MEAHEVNALGVKYRVHELKVWPAFYAALEAGTKTCELRFNDRGYREGDVLQLREYDPTDGSYSGRHLIRIVTHLVAYPTPVGGLVRGWCLMSLCWLDEPIGEALWARVRGRILDATEAELRESLGDEEFDDLARRGKAAADDALAGPGEEVPDAGG